MTLCISVGCLESCQLAHLVSKGDTQGFLYVASYTWHTHNCSMGDAQGIMHGLVSCDIIHPYLVSITSRPELGWGEIPRELPRDFFGLVLTCST